MSCFACGEHSSNSEKSVLLQYKDIHEKTGLHYWFYKLITGGDTFIMDNDGFKSFKEQNKEDFQKGLYEFAHISELR